MGISFISAARLGLFVVAAAGLAAGLATHATARDPAGPYLGMSKDEIVACAGEPHAHLKSGENAETLIYHYSGAGPVPAEPAKKDKSGDKDEPKDKKSSLADIFAGKKGDKGGKDWSCSASLKFEDGKLVSVSFAHKEVRSPYQWESEKDPKKQEAMRNEPVPTCTFSLPHCNR